MSLNLDFWTKTSCEEVGNEVGVWLNNSFGWLVRLIETYSNRGKRPVQHGRPGLGGRVWTFVRSSEIKKNSQFFQFHSIPIVTASGLSRFVKKVRVFSYFWNLAPNQFTSFCLTEFAKYTMTEWENKTKSTSIQVSRRGPNPWRVFFNGINYGKIISPPSNIQQKKVPLKPKRTHKKMIHPYQLCKYQRFIKKSLQWFFWIFEILLKPKYWVQNVL